MRKSLLAFLFALLLANISFSANAQIYKFTGSVSSLYSDPNNSAPPPLSGFFDITFATAFGDIADADGAALTGISGTFLGSTITGLSSYLSPDNKIYSSAANYFSLAGISFMVDPSLGTYHSPWSQKDYPIDAVNLHFDGNDYTLLGCNACGNIVANYKVTGSVTQVPEPETYAMFMAGLGLLGFASRKKKIA